MIPGILTVSNNGVNKSAQLLIMLLKQGAGIPGITHNPAVGKDFPRIVVGNFLVLYLPGMERKQDAEAVKVFIQIGGGHDLVRLPQRNNPAILAHVYFSFFALLIIIISQFLQTQANFRGLKLICRRP